MTIVPYNSESINLYEDFWFYNTGINVIAADTKRKITLENWSQWQNKSIIEDIHQEYKKNGNYNNGIAIITGRIWLGPYKRKYLVANDKSIIKKLGINESNTVLEREITKNAIFEN